MSSFFRRQHFLFSLALTVVGLYFLFPITAFVYTVFKTSMLFNLMTYVTMGSIGVGLLFFFPVIGVGLLLSTLLVPQLMVGLFAAGATFGTVTAAALVLPYVASVVIKGVKDLFSSFFSLFKTNTSKTHESEVSFESGNASQTVNRPSAKRFPSLSAKSNASHGSAFWEKSQQEDIKNEPPLAPNGSLSLYK